MTDGDTRYRGFPGRIGRPEQLKDRIAVEAARLMYEEGVKEYFNAKRIAAKRILGAQGGRRLRFRPRMLPSNGQIQAALLALADASEGPCRARRLFAMRVVALQHMEPLLSFSPRLIGSVATGRARWGSDIDIHVFADDTEALFDCLRDEGWQWRERKVVIRRGTGLHTYVHIDIESVCPVELTLYPPADLWATSRSSTDGKPIDRVSIERLRCRIAAEHPHSWKRYCTQGEVDGLDEFEGDRPGPFDGFL